METIDAWVTAFGGSACRFFLTNGHDTVYHGLCYAGYSPAGWRLLLFILVFAAVTVFVWRMFRPA